MPVVRLTRSYSEIATYGVMVYEGLPLCVTLELPWRSNRRNVSCIPSGDYKCTYYSSDRFPNAFLLHGVPDRSSILIHPGNTLNDTKGCILPGVSFHLNSIGVDSSVASLIHMIMNVPSTFDLEVR